MTRLFRRSFVALTALVAAGAFAACDDDDNVGPPTPLTAISKAALDEAFQDAYRTYYTYEVASVDFAGAAPFATLVVAEQSYIDQLGDLYRDRGLTPPASQWNASNVPQFQNLQEACMAAEEGEVATGMMFERLLRLGVPNDLRQAFQTQRETARQQHRLAFRSCVGDAVVPVTAQVEAAMTEALQDEFRAYYTYQRVIDDIGSLAPFPAIRDAEWTHIGALSNLWVKRDMTVPASTWTITNVPSYATLQEACAAGVDSEIALVAMYDQLLTLTLPDDVTRVFENLRAASNDHHLPAFQSCD